MQVSPEQRVELVSSFIETLIGQGCSHSEIVKSASMVADALEQVQANGQDPCEFINGLNSDMAAFKESSVAETISDVMPWDAIGNTVSTIFGKGVDVAGNLANTTVNTAGRLAPWAGAAALAVPFGVGYGGGKLVGQVTDDPEGTIDELKHQELISLLRQNAATMRRRQAYSSQLSN